MIFTFWNIRNLATRNDSFNPKYYFEGVLFLYNINLYYHFCLAEISMQQNLPLDYKKKFAFLQAIKIQNTNKNL
jgi:hypothetical protein